MSHLIDGLVVNTVELAAASVSRGKRARFSFFVCMAVFAAGLVLLAFVPEYQQFHDGTFPIPWVLHVHAAIMGAWLLAFVTQAYLVATGRIGWHRRVGIWAIELGGLAWLSMIFVEWRALVFNPAPAELSQYDWLLPGPYVYLTFPIFLSWAYRERKRPQWHKRLITFALFLSLLAAIQRYVWIPVTFGYWPFILALDVCLLVPLAAYDLRKSGGRLHPATIRGTTLLVAPQAVLLSLWGTSMWRSFAQAIVQAVHVH